jgi:uncharacterized membrane protein
MEPTDCGGSSRYWVIPLTALGVLLAATVGFFLLVWGRVIPAPTGSGPYPPFWPLFPLGFLVFWLVVFVVVRPWGGWGGARWGPRWDPVPDAREIVRIRYARGEISREQWVEMTHELSDES